MIRAIFFDFDGVLTTDIAGSYTTCKNLSAKLGFNFDRLLSCYRQHHDGIILGTQSLDIFLSAVNTCLGQSIDTDDVFAAFTAVPLNQPIMQLCQKLRERYRLGIITDNPRERTERLRNMLALDTLFASIICSADVHAKKDSPPLFQAALAALSVLPQEAIFIDNVKDNLIAPSKMGMHTYYHDHEKNDINALKNWLTEMRISL